jgi:hypothetical protein
MICPDFITQTSLHTSGDGQGAKVMQNLLYLSRGVISRGARFNGQLKNATNPALILSYKSAYGYHTYGVLPRYLVTTE